MGDWFIFEEILEELSRKRPIFHSEADFQLELAKLIAMKIEKKHPKAGVYLEEHIPGCSVDIAVKEEQNKCLYLIELKYTKTMKECKTNTKMDELNKRKDELIKYIMKESGHTSIARSSFPRDIKRLEDCQYSCNRYGILLTNKVDYYREQWKNENVVKEYNLSKFINKYHPEEECNWKTYGQNTGFNYLLIKIL